MLFILFLEFFIYLLLSPDVQNKPQGLVGPLLDQLHGKVVVDVVEVEALDATLNDADLAERDEELLAGLLPNLLVLNEVTQLDVNLLKLLSLLLDLLIEHRDELLGFL